jgi:hypothetical protein
MCLGPYALVGSNFVSCVGAERQDTMEALKWEIEREYNRTVDTSAVR